MCLSLTDVHLSFPSQHDKSKDICAFPLFGAKVTQGFLLLFCFVLFFASTFKTIENPSISPHFHDYCLGLKHCRPAWILLWMLFYLFLPFVS
jgi:quinol-cytochrome oxidoreductase complex cytochrome b subunit